MLYPGHKFGLGSTVVEGMYIYLPDYTWCECQFVVTVELVGKFTAFIQLLYKCSGGGGGQWTECPL